MPRGGKREGAGRKPGSDKKRTFQVVLKPATFSLLKELLETKEGRIFEDREVVAVAREACYQTISAMVHSKDTDETLIF